MQHTTKSHEVRKFIVRPQAPDRFNVYERGFEKPLAEFDDVETAEQYALRIAETKSNWTVEVYDRAGKMIGNYNSDDDAMPKPPLS